MRFAHGIGDGGTDGTAGNGRGPMGEAYDGEVALGDLMAAAGDEDATRRILARFAVVRLLAHAMAGRSLGWTLVEDRAAAAAYVRAVGPPDDPERETLARLVRLAGGPVSRSVCTALNDAADVALERGAVGGAFALWRLAFVLAFMHGWQTAAARAGGGIERLRETGGRSGREPGCDARYTGPSASADAPRRG